jgi:Cdc6-like AAA superfamily ATPase
MHKGRVEEEAALSHMIEAKKARELELAARALQERERRETKCRKHLALLSSYDYRKAHQKVRDQRHTGTGLWLRYDMKFRAWADSPNSDCLPCFGIPGSGKTILASTLLDELIPEYSNGSSACCFHYCDYTDCDTLDIVVILGSLIKQLLQPFDIPMEIGEKISRLYREGTSSPTRLELQSLLFQVLQRYRHTLVVIDGIDELSKADQATIIEIAHRASRSEETVVKVFVTSRSEEPYIRRSLKSYNQIELSAAVIANDVKCFVKDSVEARIESGEIVVRNPGLKMEITNALVDGAKDM